MTTVSKTMANNMPVRGVVHVHGAHHHGNQANDMEACSIVLGAFSILQNSRL